jgi:hypothetical protein
MGIIKFSTVDEMGIDQMGVDQVGSYHVSITWSCKKTEIVEPVIVL